MIGVANRLAQGPITDLESLETIHHRLLGDADFVAVSSKATADEPSVRGRLELASKAFSSVK
jgi:hypothetical protein